MEIKRFDEFISESQEFDYDDNDLNEGLLDSIKGLLTKPNLKDPKTPKDFAEIIRLASSIEEYSKGTPIDIAGNIRNLMSAFINKQGPFAGRSGAPAPKPVSMMGKGGAEISMIKGTQSAAQFKAAKAAKAAKIEATLKSEFPTADATKIKKLVDVLTKINATVWSAK